MKWLFYLIVIAYMCYRAVYGVKSDFGLSVELINYDDSGFLPVGSHKSIACKAANRNQKVEWIDPNGNIIKRNPAKGNIFAHEQYVKGRIPELLLTFAKLEVHDSGVYQCRSGDNTRNVSVCVIEPSVFVETPTEVAADLGRSITLTCQAKGQPEPNLIWKAGGRTITDDDNSEKYRVMTKYNSQGFESLLTVMSLDPEDSRVYSCISIQETPDLEDCSHLKETNISLHVNYAPIFEDGNDVKLVYGKNNQLVQLVCTANGFPSPKYQWFEDDGDLAQIEEKLIVYSEEDNQATFTTIANRTTFGKKFKCRATNIYGKAEKSFALLKLEKPIKPSEPILNEATDNSVVLNVTWDDDVTFPVDGFHLQILRMNGNRKPREMEWRNSKVVNIDDLEYINSDSEPKVVISVEVPDLEEETEYWMRIRATNNAGDGPWSDPTSVKTDIKKEVEEEVKETEEETAPEAAADEVLDKANFSDGTFYGIFFAGGILVVAAVCMFAMRLV